MLNGYQSSTADSEVLETVSLIQFLKVVLVTQVVVVLVLVAAVGEKGHGSDAAATFVFNGGLTLIKAAVIFGLIRALKRGSKVACYVVLAGIAVGLVYVIATFQPDRDMRYLGLKEFQYVVNVVNLILACVGAVLVFRALKSLHSPPHSGA